MISYKQECTNCKSQITGVKAFDNKDWNQNPPDEKGVFYRLKFGFRDLNWAWNFKPGFWVLFFGIWCLVFETPALRAQSQDSLPSISLQKAVAKAVGNYPTLKAARLEVENQEALKKTAWDLGNTQVFTAGEEIRSGQGVYTTIGIQQQQMDVFGIAPKLKAQKEKVALARSALELNQLELQRQVKQAYAEAYVARQKLKLFSELDSIYGKFERAARLRYEVEETSKLAYIAASNQVKQISLQRQQAEFDYQAALYRMNLWLVSDTFYTVSAVETGLTETIAVVQDSLSGHPMLQLASQRVKVANAQRKAVNSQFLPKVNAQYGQQEIAGQTGFYQYQLGLTFPLFFMEEQGRAQSARIRQEIAGQEYRQTQVEVQAQYQSLLQEYGKWRASWQFYRKENLPLAREQREGSALAFDEGAIDYVTFIQNLKESVQVEVNAIEALRQYLNSKFQLEFYLDSANPN